MSELKAPFAWFGGKRAIAAEVWRRFGAVANYVEPFCGSCAVLLSAPWPADRIETVNDADGLLANFWRALAKAPDEVAFHADWPCNENDLHARHAWLVGQKDSLQARLEGDPDYCDTKIAGWWCWGLALWIGGEFCSGRGPWQVVEAEDGTRQLVHLGDAGQGVMRRLVHLGNAGQGDGILPRNEGLYEWFRALADRLARVRVCCGDWSRVCTNAPTVLHGLTGAFMDPPYSREAGRDNAIYRTEDLSVAHDIRRWCLEHGGNPLLRIALCGYEGEDHEELEAHGWRVWAWKASGGYASQGGRGDANRHRERVWFSPFCLHERGLFDDVESEAD